MLNATTTSIEQHQPNKGRDSGTWDIGTVKKPRDIQNVQYWFARVLEDLCKAKQVKEGNDKIRELHIKCSIEPEEYN
ncbi:hypothetical protein Glove_132g59 [Diversispora epigaea]|uniref:Uncharacterized protein n=1 Tax=Diversispora epigaea TaxID=1348612 RepID=A0A397J033_9GLOM|nr:hypothetical protein Glove_132g59 [Diversispora epigaea]